MKTIDTSRSATAKASGLAAANGSGLAVLFILTFLSEWSFLEALGAAFVVQLVGIASAVIRSVWRGDHD